VVELRYLDYIRTQFTPVSFYKCPLVICPFHTNVNALVYTFYSNSVTYHQLSLLAATCYDTGKRLTIDFEASCRLIRTCIVYPKMVQRNLPMEK